MGDEAHLAIDLGAESGRAIVGSFARDGTLALNEVHRFPNRGVRLPSGLHWDLTGLWLNVMDGVSRGAAWAGARGAALRSIGVDTWGVDFALLGESGELLHLPRHYRDERNHAAFERTIARLGHDAIYHATGIQFMALNTLYQLVALRDAEPGLLERARHLLFMPDLVNCFLTGSMCVEATVASTSQMLDARDGSWARSLLDRVPLPHHFLHDVVRDGTDVGPLRGDVLDATGAPAETRVIAPASHDTASAVAAVPADRSRRDWCFLSSGTWSCMGAELDSPCITDAAREENFTNEGGAAGAIRFLTNLVGLWLVQECRRDFERRGRAHDYAELAALAAAAPPFRTLINPAHPPFLSPGDMPAKIAALARATKQPEPRAEGEFIRACLEGLALGYRHTLERLERVLGRRFDVIHVVGGGSRNDLLNQMTADATGRDVFAGPEEATAMGNLLVQATASGRFASLDEARWAVRPGIGVREFTPGAGPAPAAGGAGAWDEAYGRWLAARESR